jgi:spoIIIJ-associated protein
MQSVEAEGASIDAAIDNAVRKLATTRDRVEVEILSNATRGLFGIGGRKARVRATLREVLDPQLDDAPAAVTRATPAAPTAAPAPAPMVTELSPTDRATGERARSVLVDIVKYVGIDAVVEIRGEQGQIVLDLSGDTSGVLIGRRGQMLDALEYVLNRIALRDQSEATRIVIDSQNYRTRRRLSLEQMARRLAEQAKKRRRAVTLNPMSPRDRRIVHLVLQDDADLTTKSSGEGYYRKLLIIPKGASRNPRAERR